MSIRPLYDRIVVRRLEAESTSKGGIVIPNSAAEKPNRGEIVAAGPGVALDNGEIRPLSVAVGDLVLFGKYTSNEIEIDGEELLILRESDILAVIEQSKKVEKAA